MTRARLSVLPWLALAVLAFGCEKAEEPSSADESRPPVVATAAVDKALATTGDVVTYSITVDRDPAYEVTLPDPGSEIAGFRIIDLGRDDPLTVRGRIVERRWYRLRADLVGSYVLPPVALTYSRAGDEEEGQVLETSEIFVEVQSVLPQEGEVTDIRDIKPLRPLPQRIPWPLVAAVVVALSLLATLLIWLRRRRRPKILPPIPPHEAAFRALDALRSTDFSDPRAVRRFYFAISEVTRGYVEGRFGLNATDLTTEEIVASLPQVAELEDLYAAQLRDFLTATDGVKFAGRRPEAPEIESTYEQALSFVESTRPREEAA